LTSDGLSRAVRICIYGAGSIGCYLGGRLQAAGAEIGLVGRARVGDELRAHGLMLSDYRQRSERVPPDRIDFSTEASAAASADVVLVTVKSAATAEAARELDAVLRPDTIVISFQNGVRNAELLAQRLAPRRVLAGMVPFNVIARGPGAFHQGSSGALELARAPGLDALVEACRRAELPLSLRDDMRGVQWAKLLLNLNNAINALSGLPLKSELAQRDFRRCLALAQQEGLQWLARAGIRPARLTALPAAWLPRVLDVPDAWFARLGRTMLEIDPLARSSMADDLAAGRATEIDWINGEIVQLAAAQGGAAPVNARLCALVHEAEQAVERPAWSGAALLAELRAARVGALA
jgi:2-dehydropantoate 2-reductase